MYLMICEIDEYFFLDKYPHLGLFSGVKGELVKSTTLKHTVHDTYIIYIPFPNGLIKRTSLKHLTHIYYIPHIPLLNWLMKSGIRKVITFT